MYLTFLGGWRAAEAGSLLACWSWDQSKDFRHGGKHHLTGDPSVALNFFFLFSFGIAGYCLQQLQRETTSLCLQWLSLFRPHPLSHISIVFTACSPLFKALPQSTFYTGHIQVTFPFVKIKTFVVPFSLWLF